MIRANCSNVMRVMKVGVFLRIDSCESPRFAVRIAGSSKVGGCSSRDHDEGCGISSSMSAALSLRASFCGSCVKPCRAFVSFGHMWSIREHAVKHHQMPDFTSSMRGSLRSCNDDRQATADCEGTSSVTRDDCILPNLKPGEQPQAKTHESGKRRVFWWDCWLVVVLLFFCASVQAAFAESLGGVVCVQWSAGRVCACV